MPAIDLIIDPKRSLPDSAADVPGAVPAAPLRHGGDSDFGQLLASSRQSNADRRGPARSDPSARRDPGPSPSPPPKPSNQGSPADASPATAQVGSKPAAESDADQPEPDSDSTDASAGSASPGSPPPELASAAATSTAAVVTTTLPDCSAAPLLPAGAAPASLAKTLWPEPVAAEDANGADATPVNDGAAAADSAKQAASNAPPNASPPPGLINALARLTGNAQKLPEAPAPKPESSPVAQNISDSQPAVPHIETGDLEALVTAAATAPEENATPPITIPASAPRGDKSALTAGPAPTPPLNQAETVPLPPAALNAASSTASGDHTTAPAVNDAPFVPAAEPNASHDQVAEVPRRAGDSAPLSLEGAIPSVGTTTAGRADNPGLVDPLAEFVAATGAPAHVVASPAAPVSTGSESASDENGPDPHAGHDAADAQAGTGNPLVSHGAQRNSATHSAAETGAATIPAGVVDQVTHAVRISHDSGQEIRIQLSPPQLGELQIQVSLRDGHLLARLETQTPATQRLLLEGMSQLQDTLARQGITVDRIEVDLSNPASGGGMSTFGNGYSGEQSPSEREPLWEPDRPPDPGTRSSAGRIADPRLSPQGGRLMNLDVKV